MPIIRRQATYVNTKTHKIVVFNIVNEKVQTSIRIKKVGKDKKVTYLTIVNPTVSQFESAGWRLYVPPVPTPEEILERTRSNKLSAISQYDSSDSVNAFILGGQKQEWICPEDRANYLNTLQGAQRLGVETVPFLGINIPVSLGITMLDALNVYALQCVNVTNTHKTNVEKLSTVEDIEGYDHTMGYPEMLNFDSYVNMNTNEDTDENSDSNTQNIQNTQDEQGEPEL